MTIRNKNVKPRPFFMDCDGPGYATYDLGNVTVGANMTAMMIVRIPNGVSITNGGILFGNTTTGISLANEWGFTAITTGRIAFEVGANQIVSAASTEVPLADNDWHFIAGVFDGAAADAAKTDLFIDSAFTAEVNTGSTAALTQSTTNYGLGADTAGNGGHACHLRSCMVVDASLTAAQCAAMGRHLDAGDWREAQRAVQLMGANILFHVQPSVEIGRGSDLTTTHMRELSTGTAPTLGGTANPSLSDFPNSNNGGTYSFAGL